MHQVITQVIILMFYFKNEKQCNQPSYSCLVDHQLNTHLSNNLDLFILHLVEYVGILQSFHQGWAFFDLAVQEGNKVLKFCAPVFKIFGEPFTSSLVWGPRYIISENKLNLAHVHLIHIQNFKSFFVFVWPFSFFRASVLHTSTLMAASCFSFSSISSIDFLYLERFSINADGFMGKNKTHKQ